MYPGPMQAHTAALTSPWRRHLYTIMWSLLTQPNSCSGSPWLLGLGIRGFYHMQCSFAHCAHAVYLIWHEFTLPVSCSGYQDGGSTDPSLTGGGSRHRAGDRIPERSGNQNRAFIFVGTLLRWSMIPFPVLYLPCGRIHFLFVYLDIVLPVVCPFVMLYYALITFVPTTQQWLLCIILTILPHLVQTKTTTTKKQKINK